MKENEHVSTRSAQNKRSQDKLQGMSGSGMARKSTSSAKPARPAGGSVRVVPATAKAKRAAANGEGGEAAGTFDIKKIFPFFILFFVLASVITTVFALPAGVTAPIKELSKFFIVMAMAAIGFNTNIVKLVKTGGKPIFMGLCCWIGIALVSLGMQHLLGIW